MVLSSKYTKHAKLQLACKGQLACNNKHAKDNKHARDNKQERDNKQARSANTWKKLGSKIPKPRVSLGTFLHWNSYVLPN